MYCSHSTVLGEAVVAIAAEGVTVTTGGEDVTGANVMAGVSVVTGDATIAVSGRSVTSEPAVLTAQKASAVVKAVASSQAEIDADRRTKP